MLIAIRDLLRSRGRASLTDLALHFARPPEAMRGMLDHWIEKGMVSRTRPDSCGCSGCSGCEQIAAEVYEWIGPAPRAA